MNVVFKRHLTLNKVWEAFCVARIRWKNQGYWSQVEAESKQVRLTGTEKMENGKSRKAGGRAELIAEWTRAASVTICAAGFKTAVHRLSPAH